MGSHRDWSDNHEPCMALIYIFWIYILVVNLAFCGTHTLCKKEGVSDSFACSCGPFSFYWSPFPVFIWGFVASLIVTWYAMEVDLLLVTILCRPALYWREMVEEWIWWRGEVLGEVGEMQKGETAVSIQYMRDEQFLFYKKLAWEILRRWWY